jgi:acetylornithine deacetylase
MIANTAAVRVYFQFLPHENVAGVLSEVRDSFDRFCETDPFFRANRPAWYLLTEPPLLGHEIAADHPWTECFLRSASGVLGHAPAVTAAPFPCDAFLIHREFGVPTLLFGPCGAGGHNANEYAEIESVLGTAAVYLAAALNWCGA